MSENQSNQFKKLRMGLGGGARGGRNEGGAGLEGEFGGANSMED